MIFQKSASLLIAAAPVPTGGAIPGQRHFATGYRGAPMKCPNYPAIFGGALDLTTGETKPVLFLEIVKL